MRVAWLFCMAALLGGVAAPRRAAAETATLEDVMQAWRQTQDRVRSAEFRWTTKRWMKQAAITPAGIIPLNSKTDIPEQDVTFEYDRAFIFRDGLVRYESTGALWDDDQERFVERPQLYAWDGESATSVDMDEEKPYAFVYGVNQQLTQNDVRPIQFAFRMFHPDWYVFDPVQYEIAARDDVIGGLRCLRIETSRELMRQKSVRGRRRLKAVFWVSPERDFSVVRYAAIDEGSGSATVEFDLRHAMDAMEGIWVPTGWTITQYSLKGLPLEIATSSVIRYALNPVVRDDTFQLELPANAMVTDVRTGKDYIARRDGDKRIITRDELLRGADYEELLETESGEAGLRRSEGGGLLSSPATYIWACGILLLAIAVVVAIRRGWLSSH